MLSLLFLKTNCVVSLPSGSVCRSVISCLFVNSTCTHWQITCLLVKISSTPILPQFRVFTFTWTSPTLEGDFVTVHVVAMLSVLVIFSNITCACGKTFYEQYFENNELASAKLYQFNITSPVDVTLRINICVTNLSFVALFHFVRIAEPFVCITVSLQSTDHRVLYYIWFIAKLWVGWSIWLKHDVM